MKNSHIVYTLSAVVILSGCASSVEVQRAEQNARENIVLNNYNDLIAYGRKLSDKYLDLASRASIAEDVAAVSIIGAAATAAGGFLFGSSDDLIRAAGLGAGVVTAGRGYFKPSDGAQALLTASEQAHCIVVAAQTITGDGTPFSASSSKLDRFNMNLEEDQDDGVESKSMKTTNLLMRFDQAHYAPLLRSIDDKDSQSGVVDTKFLSMIAAQRALLAKAASAGDARVAIVRDGLQSVRIALRKAMQRGAFPDFDFKGIVSDIEQAIEQQNETDEQTEQADGDSGGFAKGLDREVQGFSIRDAATIAASIDELRIEVKKCAPSS